METIDYTELYRHYPEEFTYEDLLPLGRVPPSLDPCSVAVEWYSSDTPANYEQQGGHPVYGPHDIVYRLNSHGYRCPEFDETADIKIVAIGCSHTFGVGVPEEQRFSSVFAQRLREETGRSVVEWNLALPSRSPAYAARMLPICVPVLDPDIVLILFPQIVRREWLSDSGTKVDYVPWNPTYDEDSEQSSGAFLKLSSSFDDNLTMFRHYSSIRGLLRDRLFVFTFVTPPDDIRDLIPHLDRQSWASAFDGTFVDSARDNMHPGGKTHHRIADAMWERFVSMRGFEQIEGRIAARQVRQHATMGA